MSKSPSTKILPSSSKACETTASKAITTKSPSSTTFNTQPSPSDMPRVDRGLRARQILRYHAHLSNNHPKSALLSLFTDDALNAAKTLIEHSGSEKVDEEQWRDSWTSRPEITKALNRLVGWVGELNVVAANGVEELGGDMEDGDEDQEKAGQSPKLPAVADPTSHSSPEPSQRKNQSPSIKEPAIIDSTSQPSLTPPSRPVPTVIPQPEKFDLSQGAAGLQIGAGDGSGKIPGNLESHPHNGGPYCFSSHRLVRRLGAVDEHDQTARDSLELHNTQPDFRGPPLATHQLGDSRNNSTQPTLRTFQPSDTSSSSSLRVSRPSRPSYNNHFRPLPPLQSTLRSTFMAEDPVTRHRSATATQSHPFTYPPEYIQFLRDRHEAKKKERQQTLAIGDDEETF